MADGETPAAEWVRRQVEAAPVWSHAQLRAVAATVGIRLAPAQGGAGETAWSARQAATAEVDKPGCGRGEGQG